MRKEAPYNSIIRQLHYILDRHLSWVIAGIVLTAVSYRFVNFSNRWGLAYDQAHDALVARAALSLHALPLLGPFSSAGPFQTGGEWYWIIMGSTALCRQCVTSPWIMLTLTGVLFVMLMIGIGMEIGGQRLGLVAGLLAAVSTAQINQSLNLTNQTPLAVLSLLVLWSGIKYLRSPRPAYMFAMGLFASLGMTIHLQGAVLVPAVFAVWISGGRRMVRNIPAFLTGLSLPLIPLYVYDAGNGFANFRNMVQYYRVGQYAVSFEVLNRRWLTYLGVFWPAEWANIIGGWTPVALAVIAAVAVFSMRDLVRRRLSRDMVFLTAALLFMVAMMRYTRTPLFSSYLVVTHPFVLFLTAWALAELTEHWKRTGVILTLAVLLGSAVRDVREMTDASNRTWETAVAYMDVLSSVYGRDATFVFYDCEYRSNAVSLPVVLNADTAGRLSSRPDHAIGIYSRECLSKHPWPVYVEGDRGLIVTDLTGVSGPELKKYDWRRINPSDIYRETEDWRRYHR